MTETFVLCRSTTKADVLLSVHTEVFIYLFIYCFFVAQRSHSGLGLLVTEVSRSHTNKTDTR